jgi:hypothetical protein
MLYGVRFPPATVVLVALFMALSGASQVAAGFSASPQLSQILFLGLTTVSAGLTGWLTAPHIKKTSN